MTVRTNPSTLIWIGASPALQWVKTQLWEVARTELPVLVIGEPGTGRNLAARTVHALGERKEDSFVRVACGTLHEAQGAGVLFGGETPGAFEKAHGGTLFLDEIDALPWTLQRRVLHALTTKQFLRSGTPEPVDVDMRVIASTDRELGKLARVGHFCTELYYRLAIVPVKLPPLRQRKPDIPLLAHHFLHLTATRTGRVPPTLSREALVELLAHDWPGNVWELKRLLERAVVRVGSGTIDDGWVHRLLQEAPGEGDYVRKEVVVRKGNRRTARRRPPSTRN